MTFRGICLTTNDVCGLAEFYAKVLGAEAEGDALHTELKTEGAGLAIFSAAEMEKMAPHYSKSAGNGSVTLMFEVKDVDAEYLRLKTLGVEFVKLPATHPWGSRSCWFRDPDGNIIDFFCRTGIKAQS